MCVWWRRWSSILTSPGGASVFPHDVLAAQHYFPFPHNMTTANGPCSPDFTIGLVSGLGMASFLVMGVLSLPVVRRRSFELFYYSHHLFLLLLPAVLWHATAAWYYVSGGLCLWLVDRGMRLWSGTRHVQVKSASILANSNVTCLSVHLPTSTSTSNSSSSDSSSSRGLASHYIGQYCFINIPQVSATEWHPFSVSSAPGDASTTFHVKNMGAHTFSGRLQQLVLQHQLSTPPPLQQYSSSSARDKQEQAGRRDTYHWMTVSVDGPYGVPVDLESYQKLVLVAGGIGITCLHSVFRGLYKFAQAKLMSPIIDTSSPIISRLQVHLVWVVRDSGMLSLFQSTWSEVARDSLNAAFTYSFYVTQTQNADPEPTAANSSSSSSSSSSDRSRSTSSSSRSPFIFGRRPDLLEECVLMFPEHQDQSEMGVAARETREGCLVYACGPQGLMEAAHSAASTLGVEFKQQNFCV